MPDSSTITVALLARLRSDATLRGLMPDGVWPQQAPPGAKRFVIVSPVPPMRNVYVFEGLAFKDGQYLVEARALSTTGGDVNAAAVRIGAVLTEDALTVPGYGVMLCRCDEDLETVEVDAINPSIQWNRCGGHFRVVVAPN